jgi:predicted NAD/FAD-dependent oxidoreductase
VSINLPLSSCVVVGAGLSGLLAAGRLRESGLQIVVFDNNSVAGGRLATHRFDQEEPPALFDHGAQFFTARDNRFEQLVAGWIEIGLVQEWSRGFATADGSYYADGHPRYIGSQGMAAIARYLARDLDVRLNHEVVAVSISGNRWRVEIAGHQAFTTGALILTPPVPQSLALLDAGNVILPTLARTALDSITYEPCIALMVQLTGPGRVPEPGGMWPIGEPLAWIADNSAKGISAVSGSITVHAGPEFSEAYWDMDDSTVAGLLISAAAEQLQSEIKAVQIHRWRYSRPLWTHPEPCLGLTDPGLLVFAGDAFAGPRIEGAALSGLAAADWLLSEGTTHRQGSEDTEVFKPAED